MNGRRGRHDAPSAVLNTLRHAYATEATRVDQAHRRLVELIASSGPAAEVRRCAAELNAALEAASRTVIHALPMARREAPRKRRRWWRRGATPAETAAIRFWSTELMRLTDIRDWLGLAMIDIPGVLMPPTAPPERWFTSNTTVRDGGEPESGRTP